MTPAASTPSARLARYREKRDFDTTGEPRGGDLPRTDPPEGSARFVVQRHRASRLHYDVRLEIAGVLVSWAVPKGPTLDPSVRRLAVHVEDHPLEYFDFEGTIPSREYGGGDVVVWDWGTWSPAPATLDPERAVDAGELHVDLVGEKLAGRFAFVRSRRQQGNQDQWLLVHKHDDASQKGWDPEDYPRSVKSGRTNDEVAADPEFQWHSDAPASEAAVPVRAASAATAWPAPSVGEWPDPTEDELAALDALRAKGEWELAGRTVKLTNLDKVIFAPLDGGSPATKRDLIRYHARIAPHLLPYLADRPINVQRFPDGVAKQGFWTKAVPQNAPEWLSRWHNEEAGRGETEWYMVIDQPAALAFLANQAALELHPWSSRVEDVRQPAWAFIDIDPGPSTDFGDVLTLARLHRAALDHLGVQGCPKVTGKRGLQIWIPVAPGYTYDDTRSWVEQLSRAIGKVVPDLVSWEWHTADRDGRARLDFTQNGISRTLVAPFSSRPAPGAPVSVPIGWDELDDPDLRPDRWTIATVFERLAEAGDPLRPLLGLAQSLPDLSGLALGGGSKPPRRAGAAPATQEPVPAAPQRTRAVLYREAQRRDLPGRSKMTRDELADALGET